MHTNQKSDSTTAKPLAQSALYEQFDPNKLKEKYSPKFSVVRSVSCQSGLKFTAPGTATGDLTKAVQIQGDISDEQFKKVFESAQTELLDLAKSNSVTITGEPNSDIKGRPEWLFGWYFSNVKPDLLGGSYFTYSQGPIQGAVELLSQATGENNERQWKLAVVLHEKAKV